MPRFSGMSYHVKDVSGVLLERQGSGGEKRLGVG